MDKKLRAQYLVDSITFPKDPVSIDVLKKDAFETLVSLPSEIWSDLVFYWNKGFSLHECLNGDKKVLATWLLPNGFFTFIQDTTNREGVLKHNLAKNQGVVILTYS